MNSNFLKVILLGTFLILVFTSCARRAQEIVKYSEQSFQNSIYVSNSNSDEIDGAKLINKLINQAKIQKKDLYIDKDITIYSSIIIDNFKGLNIYFINGSILYQKGIPQSKQSEDIKNKFYDAIKIIDSQNIKIFDLHVIGENPVGFILGLGNEASAISIESTRLGDSKKIKSGNIHIIRPRIDKIIGTGVRSFAGENAENISISDGVFTNMAKTGINCNAEGLIVKNCVFEKCRAGMEIANSSHVIIDGNKVSYCHNTGIAVGGNYKGTLLKDGSISLETEQNINNGYGRQMGIKVINNYVYKCGGGLNADESHGPGISVTIGATFPIISNNHIYFSGRSGIQIAQSPLPDNPVIYPMVHDNVIVSSGLNKNTGPNAGVYSDVPSIIYNNFIYEGNKVPGYRQDYGVYIVVKNYKAPKSMTKNPSVLNNTIQCKNPIFIDNISSAETLKLKNQNNIESLE